MTEPISDETSCCEFCGSLVVKKRSLTGVRYSIPVSDSSLFEFLDQREDIDLFIYSRLRRAERIIEDLRAEIRGLKKDV